MKNIIYTLGLLCSITFTACNESTPIELPEANPTVQDSGADVTFTPEELQLSSKKGVCLKLSADVRTKNIAKINEIGPGWNYSWGWEFVEGQPEDKEFIPMFWGRNSVTASTLTYLKQQILAGKCKRVLGFNEPDGEKQANMTVEQALELWPQLQALKVPLGSPAIVDAAKGEWLEQFMAGCEERGYRVDFICVHNYGGTSVDAFKTKMQGIIDKYGLPILITEFAVADWSATSVENNKHTPEEVMAFMKGVLPWLEENPDVLGYAWFQSGIDSPQGWSGAFYDKDGNMTPLGEYYRDYTPNGGGDDGDGDGDGDGENPSLDPNNLVQNPGFEDDKTSWTASNSEIVTTDPISGEKTLKITGNAWTSAQQKIATPVVPGKTYKFGCTGRVEGGKLQLFIRKPGDNSVKYTVPGETAITSTENTNVSNTVIIPDGVTEVEIIMNKTDKKAVYVDDVYFIEVTE